MPIIPDTKNWTWVIERPCPECGFDATTLTDSDIAAVILDVTSRWPVVLERADVRERPNDHTWSPLEYGAHVRDVLRLYRERLTLMLDQDDPLYPNWDQDATAIAERYNEQDPAVVAQEVTDAALALAATFNSVSEAGWQRTGRRSDGASFTVSSISRYLVHDLVHHAWDVREQ
jgi:hypothetical protein